MPRLEFKRETPGFHHKKDKNTVIAVEVVKIECPAVNFKAYAYVSGLGEDGDGGSQTYGHNKPGSLLQKDLKPSDSLRNAAIPTTELFKNNGVFRWVGVVSVTKAYQQAHPTIMIDERPELCATGSAAKKGAVPKLSDYSPFAMSLADCKNGFYPVVQQTGSSKGYYVSKNNLVVDEEAEKWEQSRYLDASTMPFAVHGSAMRNKGINTGSTGWVINLHLGCYSSFVFADSNNSDHSGEVSNYLYNLLHKGEKCMFMVFPDPKMPNGLTNSGIGLIDAFVQQQIAKLQYVDNGEDLLNLFLSGGDLGKMKAISEANKILGKKEKKRPLSSPLVGTLTRLGFAGRLTDGFNPKIDQRIG